MNINKDFIYHYFYESKINESGNILNNLLHYESLFSEIMAEILRRNKRNVLHILSWRKHIFLD